MEKTKTATVTLMALMLLSVFAILPTYASTPTFTATATPTKTAYYIGEDVGVNFKLEWQSLTQNYTVNVELWNSTDKVSDLETGYIVAGAVSANSSYTKSYTVSGLTDEVGTQSYTVKVIDSGSSLTIAMASLSFTVQSESLAMSVAWDDANKDRQIDVSESVTFSVYITWAFENETTAATLKVNDAGFEKVIDNISITAGSGSVTKTYITSFDSKGTKTLTFTLEDAEGKVLATKSVSVTVGGVAQTVTENTASAVDSAFQLIYELRYIIILAVGIAVIGYLLMKRK